ncbi:MAG: helix-turn-helix transcriptional regulator [Albidovulum sp.]
MGILARQTATDSQTSGAIKSAVVEAIADWCEALHGDMPLEMAFSGLVCGLGAEAGMIVRTYLNEFNPIRVAIYDKKSDTGYQPLKTTFADGYFGPHVFKPRTASVWLASGHIGENGMNPAPGLDEWHSLRKMKEFAVLVLAGGPVTRDHIELHFREPLSLDAQASLGAVLPTMARTWAARRVGLITRSVVNERLLADQGNAMLARMPLLSISNPSRLSRAEFRVCLLLSRGLSVKGVAAELSLCDATVRSHLRAIYSKTETSGLAELVFQLIGAHLTASDLEARCA